MDRQEVKELLEKNPKKTGIRKQHLVSLGIYDYVVSLTSFMGDDAPLRERLYVIQNDVNSRPGCQDCGEPVSLDPVNSWRGFLKYCTSCFPLNKGKDGAKKLKAMATEKDFTKQHADKIRAGVKESLGIDNPMFSDKVKAKKDKTNIEKYGTATPLGLKEIQDKIEETNMERYGVKRPLQRQEVQMVALESARVTWAKNWLEGHPFSNVALREVVKATMMEKYGVENAGLLNNFKSKAETEIADFLREQGVDVKQTFRKEGKEIDIFIPELNIGIEYQGVFFHSDIIGQDRPKRHLEKWKWATNRGIRLVQVWEDDWLGNKDRTKRFLLNLIKKNPCRYNARQCSVEEITRSEYQSFLDIHHMQGGKTEASVRLALLDKEGQIVSVMGFSRDTQKAKRQNIKGDSWELMRFASIGVRGAFTKLLSNFVKNKSPVVLFSYADMEIVDPAKNVYSSNRFEPAEYLEPDFKVLVNGVRKHKFGFRDKRLKSQGIDISGLSITSAIKQMGLRITWDTGKILYMRRYDCE